MSLFFKYIKGRVKDHLPAIVIFVLTTALFIPYSFNTDMSLSSFDAQSFADGNKFVTQKMQETGNMVFWNPYVFSGMPTASSHGWLANISSIGRQTESWVAQAIHLRRDAFLIFWACLGFYVFLKALRLNNRIATIGGIAYAVSSYNVIIIVAGHLTKLTAIAYIPFLIGGTILVMDGAMIGGALILLVFSFGVFAHQQIAYYSFFTMLFVGLFYATVYMLEKKYKPLFLRGAVVVLAILCGVGIYFPANRMLLDFNKQTVRGAGELNLESHQNNENKVATEADEQKGLDIDYAFMWSYDKNETFTLAFPGIYGYGNKGMQFDKNSNLVHLFEEKFNMPEEQAIQTAEQFIPGAYYGSSPFVEGPVYLGVLVCLLTIIAIVFAFKYNKHMPWLVTITIISILMSWGSNLMWFNEFLFKYLPFYKNLRVPAMILVVTQFSMVAISMIGLDYLMTNSGLFFKKISDKITKKLLITSACLVVVGLLLYVTLDFTDMPSSAWSSIATMEGKTVNPDEMSQIFKTSFDNEPKDAKLFVNLLQMVKGDVSTASMIVKSFISDRKSVFGANVLYAFWFTLGFIVLFYLLARNIIKPLVFFIFVGGLVYFDLFYVNHSFIKKEFYAPSQESQVKAEEPTPIDKIILQDKDPNYRVLNITQNMFVDNGVSSFHKSVGGYSPAKLAVYNDLINYQMSKKMNRQVLNMLNTRYFIYGNRTQADARLEKNAEANGNAWFVPHIEKVKNAIEEMKALDSFDSKKTAIIQEQYTKNIANMSPTPAPDDYVRESYFSFDTIRYTYRASSPQLAVFSEIYSPYWKAFDEKGNELEVLKVNYALRGLWLPAGSQSIEFRCLPEMYFKLSALETSLYILHIGGFFVLLLLGFYGIYKKSLSIPKK